VGEFGNKFRKAREDKELSLDDVSNVTKISSRMLQAIEEEHFDQLPGGVFNKGFIRAYAKHLGLNSDDAVTDYLACLRQAQIDSHAGWDPEIRNAPRNAATAAKSGVAAPPKPPEKLQAPPEVQVEELPGLQLPRVEHVRPPRRDYMGKPSYQLPWRLVAIVAIVMISAVFLWTRHSRAVHTVAATSSMPSMTAPTAAVAIPVKAPSNPLPVADTVSTVNALPRPSAPASQPSQTPQPAAATHSLPATTTTQTNPVPAKVEVRNDVTIRSFGTSPPKLAGKSAATLSLVIRATENSWISVTSDGQLVSQETLIAPANTSFHATRELVVRVGNAGGVSFLWNGEELAPQGAEAEPKTFVFDSQGMHILPATQSPP